MEERNTVYMLEFCKDKKPMFFHKLAAAKMILWGTYMNSDIGSIEEIKQSWKELHDEWSVAGIGEITPIVTDLSCDFADLI